MRVEGERSVTMLSFLRWAPRVCTLLVAAAFLFLVTAELTNPHSSPPTLFRDWAGIVLLVVSIAGMFVAWNWELAGALISLVSIIVFAVMVKLHRVDVMIALAAPGLLYLLSAGAAKRRGNDNQLD